MVVMEGMRIKNAPVKVAIPASPAMTELREGPGRRAIASGRHLKAGGRDRQLGAGSGCPRHAARRAGHDGCRRGAEDSAAAPKARRRQAGRFRSRPRPVAVAVATRAARDRSGTRRKTCPAAPVVVESYPTPISRAVDGPEAHLLISNGRVVFVPHGAAVGADQAQAKRQATSSPISRS